MSALRKACQVPCKSWCITQNSLHPFFGGGFFKLCVGYGAPEYKEFTLFCCLTVSGMSCKNWNLMQKCLKLSTLSPEPSIAVLWAWSLPTLGWLNPPWEVQSSVFERVKHPHRHPLRLIVQYTWISCGCFVYLLRVPLVVIHPLNQADTKSSLYRRISVSRRW